CGPGKAAFDRDNRAIPMKIREHIPDTSETSLQASGPSRKIKRGSNGYKELITNADPNIVFREDKAGNNRRMSKRCERKLKILSSLVRKEWIGDVKVRVIRAYDDGTSKKRHHGPHSLHFSGRALDITTSDEKRDKLPMLGRLAYRAGFDWVYRAKAYIHASVKSDDEDDYRENTGCFPAASTARLATGEQVPMVDLRLGDKVASVDDRGGIIYSPVIMFLHRSPELIMDFLKIRTENQTELVITASHLIYKINRQSKRKEACFAKDVTVGDLVFVGGRSSTKSLSPGRVTSVERTRSRGVFAPLTQAGNLFVDDILVSCYAITSSDSIAHWSLAPVRLVGAICPRCFDIEYSGIHWYPRILLTIFGKIVELCGGFL
ncbi:predicted protein, partial [Nematostella vectensis]